MMELAVPPILEVKVLERRESTGKEEDAPMLCFNPNVCPTSCEETKRMALAMCSSLIFAFCTRGSMGEVCTRIQVSSNVITLCHHTTSASIISPDRGSTTDGPIAFACCEAA